MGQNPGTSLGMRRPQSCSLLVYGCWDLHGVFFSFKATKRRRSQTLYSTVLEVKLRDVLGPRAFMFEESHEAEEKLPVEDAVVHKGSLKSHTLDHFVCQNHFTQSSAENNMLQAMQKYRFLQLFEDIPTG